MNDHSLVPVQGALDFLQAVVSSFGLPFERGLARSRIASPATIGCLRTFLGEVGIEVASIQRERLRYEDGARFARIRIPAPAADPPAATRSKEDDEVSTTAATFASAALLLPADFEVFPAGAVTEMYWRLSRRAEAETGTAGDLDDVPDAGRFGFASLIRTLAAHRSLWRDVVIASFALQLAGLFVPLMTQVIFDKVVAHDATSTLTAVAVALGLFALFSAAMTWARQTLMLQMSSHVDSALGERVFAHLLKLPAVFLERRSTGNTVSRLAGLETIRSFIAGAALTLILDIPFLLLFVAVMLHYSVGLTVLALAFTAAIAVVTALATPFLRARLDEQYRASARTQAFTTEHVAAFTTIKTLQMEPQTASRHRSLLGAQIEAVRRAATVGIASGSLTQFLEQVMGHAVLIGGVLLVMRNDGFSIGMLIAFQMFSSRLSQPVTRLSGLWGQYQEARIAVARLADLMNAPAEPYTAIPHALGENATVCLQLDNVGFRYSESRPYLFRELTLKLQRGTTTVLIGRSGCGKSTLAKLLLGALRATEGRILLDGRDVRGMAANELRAHFGVVPQDVVLFSGSVYDNVRAGRPSASTEEIEHACREAGIHDTLLALDQGYQTPLGENGVGLSGGQRQRIAIARAVLRRPNVLIFDEATSGLDDQSAEAIAATMNLLKAHCAVLFIAHKIPRSLKVDVLCRLGTQIDRAATAEPVTRSLP